MSGPFRAAWQRRDHMSTPGWGQLLPMLLSLTFTLSGFTLSAQALHPLVPLRRWRLPPGSITLVFTLNGLLMCTLDPQDDYGRWPMACWPACSHGRNGHGGSASFLSRGREHTLLDRLLRRRGALAVWLVIPESAHVGGTVARVVSAERYRPPSPSIQCRPATRLARDPRPPSPGTAGMTPASP